MKIIITEEQYYNLPENQKALYWIKRRYNLVLDGLKETFEVMKFDICRIDSYDKFENKFFTVLMDSLHPHFYDDEKFDHWTYDTMFYILQDLYYVDCTEFYFAGRKKC